MKLSKTEKFEIEKCMDIQVGWLTDRLTKLCELAIHMSAVGRDTKDIDNLIRDITEARKRYRGISLRFEKDRIR